MKSVTITIFLVLSWIGHLLAQDSVSEMGIVLENFSLPLRPETGTAISPSGCHVSPWDAIHMTADIMNSATSKRRHSIGLILLDGAASGLCVKTRDNKTTVYDISSIDINHFEVVFSSNGTLRTSTLSLPDRKWSPCVEVRGVVGSLLEAMDSRTCTTRFSDDGRLLFLTNEGEVFVDVAPHRGAGYPSQFHWGMKCLAAHDRKDVILVSSKGAEDTDLDYVKYIDTKSLQVRWTRTRRDISLDAGADFRLISSASHRDSAKSDLHLLTALSGDSAYLLAIRAKDGSIAWKHLIGDGIVRVSTHMCASLSMKKVAFHGDYDSWIGTISDSGVSCEELGDPFYDSFNDLDRFVEKDKSGSVYIRSKSKNARTLFIENKPMAMP